jgi:alpha-L-fucosidase
MEKNYRPGFSYQDFAPQFTAEFYNATEWVELFKRSGARYVIVN